MARRATRTEQLVDQYAGARAAVAVHHAERRVREECLQLARLVGTRDDPLHAPVAAQQPQARREERLVVAARGRVEQMDRSGVALAALGRREPALRAHREHLDAEARAD